ncbi:MAG TPA: hypothetical protein VGI40_02185 [Pirellulaceae bacterium]|jgi:hypothetical protein
MRYRLRTLLIAMAVGPPVLAILWFDWPIIVAPIALGVTAALVLFGVSALLPGD